MMTSFNTAMQNEKIAVIGLVVIIAGVLSVYLAVTYGEDIFKNLSGDGETIEIGDCVDVHYTGSFENGTVFDTSYADVANQSGIYDETRSYGPLKTFISFNLTELPPEGYDAYHQGIEGFMEGLIGLKEGETKTIGPIPPEKAYGVYPKIGDVINLSDPETGQILLDIEFVKIIQNAPIPEEYVEFLGNGTTVLFTIRDNSYHIGENIGEKFYLYTTWENSTFATKINETLMWYYITPPEDQRENFTWIDSETTETYYWENASSVTSMNNSTIVVTHTPEINATMDVQIDLYSTITYTVVNVTDTKINVSYDDGTGNISYDSFNRTVTIERNQTYDITFVLIQEILDYQLLQPIKEFYDPELTLSVHDLADESLLFEVKIVNVYKTSQEES